MTLLLRFWRPLLGVLLIVGFAGFFYMKGHKSGLAAGRAELEAFRQEVGARILEANQRADQAAADFEDWKRKQRPRVITVIKEVDRVLDANPEWSGAAVPPSVSDSLAAAARDIGASEPLGTVSTVPGGSGDGQPGTRPPVSGRLDLGTGVPGAAETTL